MEESGDLLVGEADSSAAEAPPDGTAEPNATPEEEP
jgi:hypothetical protein